MANLDSAIKRVRVNRKKQAQNLPYKSDMRTQIKKVEAFINANDVENAKSALQTAFQTIDKAIQKGVVHRNNGNRHKARLSKKIRQLQA
ncbi:MAG TPA: 30S ribosomal protein S20 [Bacillota bacterium]|nr:30S ribosomal protein S20 [Bacillota bacterium]